MTIKLVNKNIKLITLNCGCKIERIKGMKDKWLSICFKHSDVNKFKG